jgi:hypothetical protein
MSNYFSLILVFYNPVYFSDVTMFVLPSMFVPLIRRGEAVTLKGQSNQAPDSKNAFARLAPSAHRSEARATSLLPHIRSHLPLLLQNSEGPFQPPGRLLLPDSAKAVLLSSLPAPVKQKVSVSFRQSAEDLEEVILSPDLSQ